MRLVALLPMPHGSLTAWSTSLRSAVVWRGTALYRRLVDCDLEELGDKVFCAGEGRGIFVSCSFHPDRCFAHDGSRARIPVRPIF